MKNKKLLFALLAAGVAAVSALIFAACSNISVNENFEVSTASKENSAQKAMVKIAFDASSVRTAIPSIEWENFTYTLSAIQNPGEATQKDPVTLFTDRTKEQLVQGVAVDLGKYKFTLTAKKDGKSVLAGTSTADLKQNATLTFKMLAVTGSTGSATVKINFPMDGTVKSVKAAYSTELFAQTSGENVEIKVVSGVNTVTFSKENIPSATEQYAQFWFYDQTGTVVYSGIEALCIVGGCASYSEISLTSSDWHTYACAVTLKKDGINWEGSGKTVKLVNKTDASKTYVLKAATEGAYTASVSEAEYFVYVNDENTNVPFSSVNKLVTVNYWTASLVTEKGCSLKAVSGGYETGTANQYLVLDGANFVYQISLSDGYQVKSGTSLVIKNNGAAVENPAFDTNYTEASVRQAMGFTVTTLETIDYTLRFVDENGNVISSTASDKAPYWASGYTAPSSFTVENPATLPGVLDVKLNGQKFDAWVDADDGVTVVKATDSVFKNLTLKPTWKEFYGIDSASKTVFANGFNLLIKANGSATEIYVDYDGDGVIDAGVDEQVVDSANGNNTDFTNYHLTAGNAEGKEINSDFTFTMTGGRIASMTGLDSADNKKSNKSVVNLSGTAIIGSAENVASSTDAKTGVKVTTATNVNGIDLDTISGEKVNIVGLMSGSYKIYCKTSRYYDAEKKEEYLIAFIQNSTYANLKQFECYTYDNEKDTGADGARPYTKDFLKMKKYMSNGVSSTNILISEDSGVELPTAAEIGDVTIEFSLGNNTVTTECSVFSISVEKGTFRVNERTTITENTSTEDKAVEATLTYMAQPTATTYDDSFSFDKTYVYMHVMSEGNVLTENMASDFLRQVYFKRDDPSVAMTVKVNLETVPSEEIASAGVKYLNGSFYKGVLSSNVNWITSYNGAKKSVFNGLNGYLMNVTSVVENNYIFTHLGTEPGKNYGAAWTGGARYDTVADHADPEAMTSACVLNETYHVEYDSDTRASPGSNFKTDAMTYRWQSGPEAGMPFTKFNWTGTYDGSITGNGADHLKVDSEWAKKYYSNWSSGEPNDKKGGTSSEECVHYLDSGLWNDYNWDRSGVKGYVIEYTPYDTYWNGTPAGEHLQKANYSAIVRTAVY